jgi:SAM-dependent methyltransferase
VIGINPRFEDQKLAKINPGLPDGCSLRKGDIRSTSFPDNSIGAIFSVGVFEHLLNLELCLAEMHRVLMPGGCVYAEFGPIWSSSLGHHVHAAGEGEESKHSDPTKNPIPDYGHLLMSRSELDDYLKGKVPDALRREIIDWVYDKPNINRLFLEDYLRLMRNSDFELVHIGFDREYISEDLLGRLKNKNPGYRIFDVRNLQVLLRKRTGQQGESIRQGRTVTG